MKKIEEAKLNRSKDINDLKKDMEEFERELKVLKSEIIKNRAEFNKNIKKNPKRKQR